MAPLVKVSLLLLVLLSPVPPDFSLPLDSNRTRTILDYYFLLPTRYLQLQGLDSRAARESALSIKDLDNQYLQIRQHPGEAYSALTLFERPDGTDIVAVETRSCIGGCSSKLTVLFYENGQWIDITSETVPIIDDVTLKGILIKQITSREENLGDFHPRILYTLPRGGSVIDVSEHWSGMEVGWLEWERGKFVFRVVSSPELINSQAVLASVSNAAGDRLQIIGLNPDLPVKLPLKGHLRVSVSYELTSVPDCLIWVSPVIKERRLPDHFTSGSMFHKQGSGVTTGYFGFNNEAHIDHLKVVMADRQHKELLSLTYKVNADWEGAMECPSLRVTCFSNGPNSAIPVGCTVYPSGLQPGQQLTYQWTISDGAILSGQGTHHIKIDTGRSEYVTAMVEVVGLPGMCNTNASFASTAATVGRPSK